MTVDDLIKDGKPHDAIFFWSAAEKPGKVTKACLSKMPVKCGVTPENITKLHPGQIFVFGSNLAGQHMGGAARAAVMHFGAKMGVGVGIQGQSYAIPTMQGGVETIRPYVDQFLDYAKEHLHNQFLVTKIGCGIAGFTCQEIAPLFAKAIDMPNISLPQEFIDIIRSSH